MPDAARAPRIAVAVPSHERPVRLRWLLNALAEQTLPGEEWEVVVVHDSAGPETEALLEAHPLARAGVLRHRRVAPTLAGPKRNIAWREARAPLVAFTDDDCRPPPDWLERALAAAESNPGAVVQGATRPDPDEAHLLAAAPHGVSQEIDPPTPWGESCNIVYPRALLEALDGFEEAVALQSGEDTDLLARAREQGAPLAAAPEVLTWHAVDTPALPRRVRVTRRWGDGAFVYRRHPAMRRHLTARVLWKPSHGWLLLAAGGLVLGRRRPAARAMLVPWLVCNRPPRGRRPRGLLRSVLELPGQTVVDAAEVVAMVRGSVRHRTPVL